MEEDLEEGLARPYWKTSLREISARRFGPRCDHRCDGVRTCAFNTNFGIGQ